VTSKLVLIVDDNEQNAKLARDVLELAGLRTLLAATGTECVALALEHRPDVVLLDLRLPDLDGVDVARLLRQDERTRQLPVVAVTALDVPDAAWLREAGLVGSIGKPIDILEFPSQVLGYCSTP
jgi:two-component system cell cycle response regulator DivK